MISDAGRFILTVTDDIHSVEADEWNALAWREEYSPFLEHGFLASLESAGCVGGETGWYPRHFLLKQEGRLIAAAPAYARTHSMGDFIFDQGLAQAAESMGKDYYPKLVATLPFTPSPGYRFLISADHPELTEDVICPILIRAMEQYAQSAGLHSVSILFADPSWPALPEILLPEGSLSEQSAPAADAPSVNALPVEQSAPGVTGASMPRWLEWLHQYFLWENRGYRSFDDYLARFDKNQRRNIRRERASVRNAGIRVEPVTGADADEELLDAMYQLYEKTNEQFGPWAAFFLNQEWFHEVCRLWGERILFFVARREGENKPLAISMTVQKGAVLVGRYWGTSEFVSNLHFELCYYAPLEYAIQEGLELFDPGMGSPHKARRGFESHDFSTWHRFFDDEISALFTSVLPQANLGELEAIEDLNQAIPWK